MYATIATFIVELSAPYSILEYNPGFCNLTGYQKEDISSCCDLIERLIYQEDYRQLLDSIAYQLSISNLTTNRVRILTKQGEILTILCNGQAFVQANGKEVMQCILSDITVLESAAQETERAKSDLEDFAKNVQSGVSKHLCDNFFTIVWANDYFYLLTGYSKEEWYRKFGNNCLSVIIPEDIPILINTIRSLQNSTYQSYTFRARHKNGSTVWLNANAALSGEVIDNYPVANLVLSDVTALKEAEQKAYYEEQKYQIVSAISEEIPFEYDTDADTISYTNKYYLTFGANSLVHNPEVEQIQSGLISADTSTNYIQLIEAAKRGIDSYSSEFKMKHTDGHYYWYYSSFATIRDSEGVPTKIIGILRNIHNQKEQQQVLIRKAQVDSMTGIYNKATTAYLIRSYLRGLNHSAWGIMLLFDIDDFKNINDTFGHVTGDTVINRVVTIFKHYATDKDILGRIGGDEFTLFIPDAIDTNIAIEKANQIKHELTNLFTKEKDGFTITLSVGIAATNVSIPYNTLLDQTDTALYQAKATGKNTAVFYNQSMDRAKYNNARNTTHTEIVSDIFDTLLDHLYLPDDPEEGICNALQFIINTYPISKISIWLYNNTANQLTCYNSQVSSISTPFHVDHVGDRFPSQMWEEIASLCSTPYVYCGNPSSLSIFLHYPSSPIPHLSEFIQYKIQVKQEVIGYINIDGSEQGWSKEEISSFYAFCKLIGEVIIKQRSLLMIDNLYANTIQILNAIPEPIYIVDRTSMRILYHNACAKSTFEQIDIGLLCHQVLCNSDKLCGNCPLRLTSTDKQHNSNPVLVDTIYGPYDVTSSPIRWIDTKNAYLILCHSHKSTEAEQIIQEIEQQIALQKRIFDSSYTDIITGFGNFEKFKLDVPGILKEHPNQQYALYYGNIKNFKYINEVYGHQAGEELLTHISNVLASYSNEDEAFARVISDTFVVLKRFTSTENQKLSYTHIANDICSMGFLKQNKYSLEFSFGIVIINQRNRHLNISMLIDQAVVAKKSIGDNYTNHPFAIYDEAMNARLQKEANYESQMELALANGEFQTYLQPKFNLKTKQLAGSEALVRWDSTLNGFLVPDTFIPLFERNGFISEVDMFMLEEVCKTLRDYANNHYPLFPCSVNMSRITLSLPDCVTRIYGIVQKYGISPEFVEFEITENVFMDDYSRIVTVLNSLRDLHFSISMDDFGSGYSSLRLLKDLPIDVLKIDKDFLKAGNTDHNSYAIIKSIIEMAHSLNIKVVCEGIETEEQMLLLKNLNCELGQGYWYAKPMPLTEFHNLVKREAFPIAISTDKKGE